MSSRAGVMSRAATGIMSAYTSTQSIHRRGRGGTQRDMGCCRCDGSFNAALLLRQNEPVESNIIPVVAFIGLLSASLCVLCGESFCSKPEETRPDWFSSPLSDYPLRRQHPDSPSTLQSSSGNSWTADEEFSPKQFSSCLSNSAVNHYAYSR